MDLYADATDYLDAKLRLIPLHPIVAGKCGCGEVDCEAAGKHPLRGKWQFQKLVDTATLHDIWRVNYKCTGFGWALDADHIVIDVDKRNGGLPSLEALQKDIGIDFFEVCTAIVQTGGGGWHFYFRKLDSGNLGFKLPRKYVGIDIKQAGGFVVTAGSQHASGNDYEWHSAAKSDLENLAVLPDPVRLMLSQTYADHKAAIKESGRGDVEEIKEMLRVLPNDLPYDEWLKVGMAIHNATDGGQEGFDAWEAFSANSPKYRAGYGAKKWFSFGKYTGPSVGSGSLVKLAREHGWEPNEDTAFLSAEELAEVKEQWARRREERSAMPSMDDDSDIDLYAPPGLLGRINDYVYSCSQFPNKNLALACSISVLTNAIGRRFCLPGKYSTFQPNLLVFCIAGASVGKDAVLDAAQRMLSGLGLGPVISGKIKSDKDLTDALEANQYAMYFNDEFGQFLMRLENASKKGSASYLEGIIGTIMDSFTKGDKVFLVDKTRRSAILDKWKGIINTTKKELDDGKHDSDEDKKRAVSLLNRAKYLLNNFANGLPAPFISFFATATPRTMVTAFSGDSTENGFLSRALVFMEHETNPRPRPEFQGKQPIPNSLKFALQSVAFQKDDCPFGRVDSYAQEQEVLNVEPDALIYLERAREYFFDLAEIQKENSLESLPRRAPDSVFKLCIAMGAEGRTVTLQIARYAVKLVRQEIDRKIKRVASTEGMQSKDTSERLSGVRSKVLEVCTTDKGETGAVIWSKVKSGKIKQQQLADLIDELIAGGQVEAIDTGRKYQNGPVYRFKTTVKGGA